MPAKVVSYATSTARLSYRDYEQAFQVMRSGNAGKVILEWS